MLFVRLGSRLDLSNSSLGDMAKLSGGIGLNYDRFVLDYAFAFYGDLGMTSMASLAVEFRRATTRPEQRFALPRLGTADPAPQAADAPTTQGWGATELLAGATSCEEQGDFWCAATNYISILDQDPNNAHVWKRLGLIYHRFGYKQEAKACMRTVLELDPRDEQALRVWQELTK